MVRLDEEVARWKVRPSHHMCACWNQHLLMLCDGTTASQDAANKADVSLIMLQNKLDDTIKARAADQNVAQAAAATAQNKLHERVEALAQQLEAANARASGAAKEVRAARYLAVAMQLRVRQPTAVAVWPGRATQGGCGESGQPGAATRRRGVGHG